MRYFIEFSYDGRSYHGWQFQPNAITVQEVLENAMSLLMGEKIELTAAGRTDAGVHARQMFAHFDFEEDLPENIIFRLNAFLPEDIAVQNFTLVHKDAHARFDATERSYIYRINNIKNPFFRHFAYNYYLPLDVEKMNEAAKLLLGQKDFHCFSKSNTDVKTYNCDIREAYWEQRDGTLEFYISADRFLRNMVRAIVGTLLQIGSGKIEVADLKSIIESKNRSEAGFSVPAQGLYLQKISYPKTIFKN